LNWTELCYDFAHWQAFLNTVVKFKSSLKMADAQEDCIINFGWLVRWLFQSYFVCSIYCEYAIEWSSKKRSFIEEEVIWV